MVLLTGNDGLPITLKETGSQTVMPHIVAVQISMCSCIGIRLFTLHTLINSHHTFSAAAD